MKKIGIDSDYKLIPMNEITDEAREIAVRWVENYGTMGFDIENKHKLASDIMNYARRKSGTLENAINGYLDGIEMDNTADVIGKSHVIGMLKDLLKLTNP